jgi:hypothetical protein
MSSALDVMSAHTPLDSSPPCWIASSEIRRLRYLRAQPSARRYIGSFASSGMPADEARAGFLPTAARLPGVKGRPRRAADASACSVSCAFNAGNSSGGSVSTRTIASAPVP